MKKYLFTILLALGLAVTPLVVTAAQTSAQRCQNFQSQFNGAFSWVNLNIYCTANALVMYVIQLALGLAASVAILFIILGGFWYLSSAGNEERAEKGQKTLTNAVIGLVVIILSFVIVRIISNTLISGIGTAGTGSSSSSSQSTSPNQVAGQIQFNGPKQAAADQAYTFAVTVPAATVSQLCVNTDPVGYVNVTSTSNNGGVTKVGDLVNNNGQLTGSMSTAIVTSLGYGLGGNISDVLPLTLYVCGQNAQIWNVQVTPSTANTSKTCDPALAASITDGGQCQSLGAPYVWTNGTPGCVCAGATTCSQSNNSSTGENTKDCGIGFTCNSGLQCVAMSNPNNVTGPAAAAQNMSFTMQLQSDKKTLLININANASDKIAACGGATYTDLGNPSKYPLVVFVNGQSTGGNGAAADFTETVNFPNPITSSQSVSISICGQTIGSGAQTLAAPTR